MTRLSVRARRRAAAALAAAVTIGWAAAAWGAGESTVATLVSPASGSSATFTWTYAFNQSGGHGFSNLAVGFCSADVLASVVAGPGYDVFGAGDVPGGHSGFGPGIKLTTNQPAGTITVAFDRPWTVSPTGLRVQSHSGDGQKGDLVTTAAGPGPCTGDTAGDTTTTTTTTAPGAGTAATTTTAPGGDTAATTTTTAPGGDGSGATTTTTTGRTTVTTPSNDEPGLLTNPPVTTTTTTPATSSPTATAPGPAIVAGETLLNDTAEDGTAVDDTTGGDDIEVLAVTLPRTGASTAALTVAGLVLLVAGRLLRRDRSTTV